ncbi:MAG: hypothetical protein ACRDH9_07700 [Actinomycetota bacterium]
MAGSVFGLVLAVLTVASPVARAVDGWSTHDRLYLLGSADDFFYWSVDPEDPELDLDQETRTCSTVVVKGMPGHESCLFHFLPGSLLAEPVAWGSQKPLRFHLELEVNTPGEPSVTVQLERNAPLVQATAAEVAPGVWEATLPGSGAIATAGWSMFTVAVTSSVPHLTASMELEGASFVELPEPVTAAGVPQLLAEEQPPPSTTRFDTPMRSFRFNDDDWRVLTFEGDLSQMREFQATLDHPAETVLAWVEAYDTGFTHDILGGRDPDARKLTETFETDLFVDGTRIAHGFNSGVYGVGTDQTATTDVPVGALSLRVDPTAIWPTDVNHDYPYRAYILIIDGERTLSRMRWPSMFGGYPGIAVTQAPLTAVCPGDPQQQIPVTDEVRTFDVDMEVDTLGGPTSQWTLAFLLPPNSWILCGNFSRGESMRFTFPHQGTHLVGAMLQDDTTHAEWHETVFRWDVRFTYSPRPLAGGA